MDVSRLARDRVSEGAPATSLVRVLRGTLRHGRVEQHVLPTAAADDGRAMGGAGASGFTYALKLGQFGSHRMKLRDAASWLPEPLGPRRTPRSRAWADARPAAAAVEAQRRASRRVPRPSRRRRCDGRSRSANRLGCTTTCSSCCAAIAPRCASTTCSPNHPWELTTDWSYIRFHGPEALTRKYYGRYGGRRLWRPPTGCSHGSTADVTSTPTSTTTGTDMRSRMRRG